MAGAGGAVLSAAFDGGNIEVVCVEATPKALRATLRIRKEPYTEGTDCKQHSQW